MWHQKKTASSAVSGPSQSFKLDITAGKTATFDYEFDNLSNEYYYRFKSLYKEQSGNLSGGGLWDVKIDMQNGYLTWKSDGTVTGKTAGSSISILSTVCGVYANTSTRITRMTPNSNPNTIYAYAQNMELPASLSNSNAVCGNHADHINLVNDQPYYLPASFVADSASFTYTFAENEDGTKWHAFTMPFSVDSISIDDFEIQLGDTLNHFWIYEFAAEGDDGEVIFEPTTYLRRGTPYIIAADANMAGRSIVFHAFNAPFYKMGSNKMLVSTSDYHFYGNTCSPKIKDCYMLNADGTAFEYVTTTKAVPAMEPYFTTNLPADLRPENIVLPEIPVNNNEDPTGVNNIRGYQNRYIYNLAGQRLSKPVKGINIINGKKILR